MKIILIGYMGSGKSTVGRLLADRLNLVFTDLDEYIAAQLNSPIPTIFRDKGELFFRKAEHQYLREIMHVQPDLVLATGGGTPCYGRNMESMMEYADMVVYLKVSIPELVRRLLKEKKDRPLIKELDDANLPEFIGKHLFERNPFYSRAHHTVLSDGKETDEIVREIMGLL